MAEPRLCRILGATNHPTRPGRDRPNGFLRGPPDHLPACPRQDVKAFPNLNAFEDAITQVVEIAKQNEGWLKSQPQAQGHGQSRRAMAIGPAAPGAP